MIHLFNSYDLTISKIQKINVHGGSLRITAIHKNKNNKFNSKTLKKMILLEKNLNLK